MAESVAMTMIGKIDHVGIAVRSIEEARRLYEALGLRVEAIEEVPHEGVRVALIPCGETRIELLEPLGRGLADRASSWRSAARASTTSAWRATTCAPTTPRLRAAGLRAAAPGADPRRRRLLGPVRPPARARAACCWSCRSGGEHGHEQP